MVNKIVTTFEQDYNRPESKEFYWKHFLYRTHLISFLAS